MPDEDDDKEGAEPVSIENVTCIRETEPGNKNAGALLCRVGQKQVWIPKSQIDDDSEVYDSRRNSVGKLVIPQWLANERGLI